MKNLKNLFKKDKLTIYTKDKVYQLVRVLKEDGLKNPNMEDLKRY